MYCSHCGSSMPESLNYCKNCGARNERNAPVAGGSSARPMAFVAMMIGVIGLFGFYGILRELLRSPLDPMVVVILMIVYSVALLAMFAIPISVWRRSEEARTKGTGGREPYHPTASFRAVNTAQLEEPREMPASVTEHTTRTLDQVPLKRD
jgi:hypothetical protein